MVTLEQVERLRGLVDVSYQEAKAVLEETGGNVLEAVITLERRGQMAGPADDGQQCFEEAGPGPAAGDDRYHDGGEAPSTTSFAELIRRGVGWLRRAFGRINRNRLEIYKDRVCTLALPAGILLVLLLIGFWFVLGLLVVGLFLDYRYRFSGPELGQARINQLLDRLADMAGNMKKGLGGGDRPGPGDNFADRE